MLLVYLAIAGCHSGRTSDGSSTRVRSIDPDLQAEIDGIPVELQAIVDGALSHFARVTTEDGTHLCPHPVQSPGGGHAVETPPLMADCNSRPQRRCVPAADGGGPGFYDVRMWTDNSVWAGLGFAKTLPHSFHYDFVAVNETAGFGACSFTAKAFGDLDADVVFSTYELRGRVDELGVEMVPLIVDRGLE
jgi:hypothetical protein